MTTINRYGTRGFIKDEATSPGAVTFNGSCIMVGEPYAAFEIAGTDTVEEKIVDRLALMAAEITTDNGYRKTVKRVYKKQTNIDKITEFPAINILVGEVRYDEPYSNEAGRLKKNMQIVMVYYLRGNDDRDGNIADATGDIELRFFEDTPSATPAYNVEGESLIILPQRHNRFNVEDDKRMYGVAMEMEIVFRQSRRNPSLQY